MEISVWRIQIAPRSPCLRKEKRIFPPCPERENEIREKNASGFQRIFEVQTRLFRIGLLDDFLLLYFFSWNDDKKRIPVISDHAGDRQLFP